MSDDMAHYAYDQLLDFLSDRPIYILGSDQQPSWITLRFLDVAQVNGHGISVKCSGALLRGTALMYLLLSAVLIL